MYSHLQSAAPVLASLDIRETLTFYQDTLGFRIGFGDEGYGIVHRDDIQIHFWKCSDKRYPENTSCYISLKGVDALYQEYQAKGVIHPNGKLENRAWGMREFAILDIHGNLIRFGELLGPEESL